MAPFVSLGLCGLGGAAGLLGDRRVVAPERSAGMASTHLCHRVAQAMGGHTRCAEFAQISSLAFVEAVVCRALTHRVDVFKCSVIKKNQSMEAICSLFLGY